jgi:hypothetical protein
MEVSAQLHAPAVLPPAVEPPITVVGPQGRSGRREEEQNLAPAGNRTLVVWLLACQIQQWLISYVNIWPGVLLCLRCI